MDIGDSGAYVTRNDGGSWSAVGGGAGTTEIYAAVANALGSVGVYYWDGTSWSNVGSALPRDFSFGLGFDVYDDGATRTPSVMYYSNNNGLIARRSVQLPTLASRTTREWPSTPTAVTPTSTCLPLTGA
ncbi:MAG: hypothetical protein GVY29_09770 [Spirochaetes bacterium]|jgi:arabinogalactan endo-1,4-beta-galactosidase|nr:hypothetical protein [Spirochaetota bacterium]